MPELIFKEEVHQIIGAAMDVYYQLGQGFSEPIYQEAFEIELGRPARYSIQTSMRDNDLL